MDLVLADNVASGLDAVVRNQAYAFVGSLAAVGHVIGREAMTNLKVCGETPYAYELSVGINKDMPVLAGIVQKAVDAVTEEEKSAILKM